MEKIGIAILNYKTSILIETLIKDLNFENFKVLIIDNSELKEEKEKLLKINQKNVDIIFIKNEGYYKGNYEGVKFLKEKYNLKKTIIMNPDVSFDRVEMIAKELKDLFTENVFITAPKIVVPGSITRSSPIINFNPLFEIFFNITFPVSNLLKGLYTRKLSKINGVVFSVEGSFYMVDNEKFLSINEYFKDIFLYGEEIIYGLIAKKNGWEIIQNSNVYINHNHPHGGINKNFDKYYPKSLDIIIDKFNYNKILKKYLKISFKYKFFIKNLILKIK